MSKKMIFGALMSLLGVASFATASFSLSNNVKDVKQPAVKLAEEVDPSYDASDFADAQELTTRDLKISITKSAVTSKTQSYDVNFSSQVETWTNRYRLIWVIINDDNFTSANDYPALKGEEEKNMPHFTGAVYGIDDSDDGDIFIPRYMSYTTRFTIDVSSINGGVLSDDALETTKNIYIHSEIDIIGEDAFSNFADSSQVHIYCEASERPDGWSENWTDVPEENITWGYEFTDEIYTTIDRNVSGTSQPYGTGKNFFLGFKDETKGINLPLVIKYDSKNTSTGEITTNYEELPIVPVNASLAGTSRYEGVGSNVAMTSYSKNIDIELEPNEEILDDTISFYNIYPVEIVTSETSSVPVFVPKEDEPYWGDCSINYVKKENINEYITYDFELSSSFSGYTSLQLRVDKVDGIYEQVKGDLYETNYNDIASGRVTIRYRFTALNNAQYRIIYEDNGELVESIVNINTPIPRFILESQTDNNVSFLIENSTIGENFDASKVKYLSLLGLNVTLDLFTESGTILVKSSTTTRFGEIPLLDTITADDVLNYYDGDTVLIWTSIAFVCVYVIGAIILYFYLRNKFKNDEFRRMKPKKYLKSAIILGCGLLTAILAIIFIFFRSVPFNNAIVVFNPLDIYVIIFTIASVFFAGYYIRLLVHTVKTNKERKRILKLKLDETSDDDGTK